MLVRIRVSLNRCVGAYFEKNLNRNEYTLYMLYSLLVTYGCLLKLFGIIGRLTLVFVKKAMEEFKLGIGNFVQRL